MSELRQDSKPTLETLLRLKRAERPTPEFWANFEKELRQKQLTALVEKRRWWHGWPVLLSRRVCLPAGAAAAAAFALVAMRHQVPGHVAHPENSAPRIAAADPAVEVLPVTEVASTGSVYEEPAGAAREAGKPVTVSAGDDPAVAPLMVATHEEISPSARSIAANLARLEQAEPELLNAFMGNRLSSPARVVPASARIAPEPASGDSVPRYRLIARYADRALSPEPAAPELVRQRLARRLSDDLYDDVSRIGVGGDRVSLKF